MFKDKLGVLDKGACKLEGYLGKRINSCIENGIMSTNYPLFVEPFITKTDDKGDWGGEFFGKWYTSAALAYRYQPKEKYLNILNDAISKFIATQDENGRLSSSSIDFSNWDIWGRKYSLLALISHYEQTGDERSLEAASRSVDNLISVTGKGKKKITETGLRVLESLSSSSILEPVVLLYRHTNNEAYLDYAKYIVSLWSEANSYTNKGMRLIEDALEQKEPIYISAPKGYEMMSCFEGICELYRATGDEQYLKAVINFGKQVIDKEIMIVGSGSSVELWCDGKKRQTELLEHPMETCVTATWIKLCFQLLRLTGDSMWADQMEITFYNALLGALVPDGSWWAYFSPLVGTREKSHVQMSYVKSSCCVVNGPRGLMTAPHWAVMMSDNGPVINLYNEGSYNCSFDGENFTVKIDTKYPEMDKIRIKIQSEKSKKFSLKLRIPYWSKKTDLSLNGKPLNSKPGTYLEIKRKFSNDDEIILGLDMRGRVITSPGSVNYKAVMCGPVVLAMDNRLIDSCNERLWLNDDTFRCKFSEDWKIDYYILNESVKEGSIQYIELTPSSDKPDNIWIAYDVPFLSRPTHFFKHRIVPMKLCDYSSAGNEYSINSVFRVWLAQPTLVSEVFPEHTNNELKQSLV